jgi:hypothetical protein
MESWRQKGEAAIEDVISMCKGRVTDAMEHFLCVLRFVPADKLTWSPAPTAKSALQIAAHCAGYSGAFAPVIRSGLFPRTTEEFLGPIESIIKSIATPDQAEAALRRGTAETLAALDAVKPDQIGASVLTPIGLQPFTFFLDIPARHLFSHTAQLDYLQTCWGDQEVHF